MLSYSWTWCPAHACWEDRALLGLWSAGCPLQPGFRSSTGPPRDRSHCPVRNPLLREVKRREAVWWPRSQEKRPWASIHVGAVNTAVLHACKVLPNDRSSGFDGAFNINLNLRLRSSDYLFGICLLTSSNRELTPSRILQPFCGLLCWEVCAAAEASPVSTASSSTCLG